MKRISLFIEKRIAPRANKMASNRYLRAIQNTFLALIPFFTLGSFALVITCPPSDYTVMDPGALRSLMYGWSVLADFTRPVLDIVYLVTMPLMALYVAVGLGYFLSKHYKMNSIMPTFVSTASFVIALSIGGDGSIATQYFDATGLYTSIIVSILALELYRFLVNKKIGKIELSGTGVPPALADSIGNLVPVLLVLVIVGLACQILFMLTNTIFPQIITLFMSPLVSVVDNVFGVIVLAVIVMIFWWFGIHDSVITSALDPILYSNLGENAAAFAAGTAAIALPHIVTEPFWWNFMAIGGSGATLGLAFLAITSKSKQIKTIGKIAFVPSFFNINEPLIFGLPLMYNPIMMLPFILVMPLNGVITYLAMDFGLVSKTFAYASWNMFFPIAAFIDTLDIKAVLLAVILIAVDIILYLPFFKAYEKQKIKEEMEEN